MRWLRNLFARSAPSAAPASPASAPPSATPASTSSAPADGSDWVSHQRTSAQGPVALAVDLSLAARAPDQARPRLVRVRCALAAPRPDGQPEPAEAERLAQVEDVLCRELGPLDATYAGRVTLAGAREHLFYLPAAASPASADGGAATPDAGEAAVEAALERVRAAVAGYQLTLLSDEDPGWHAYREELFPTPRTLRFLLDRRALEGASRRGAEPRPVDHQASFPGPDARERFAAEAAVQGFLAVARRDDAPAPNPFAVDLRRTDALALRELHAVTWSLTELAARHGGAYDGWGIDEGGAGA